MFAIRNCKEFQIHHTKNAIAIKYLCIVFHKTKHDQQNKSKTDKSYEFQITNNKGKIFDNFLFKKQSIAKRQKIKIISRGKKKQKSVF